MARHDIDVLIAGAGPVGLMAASQLARSGVSVRLVDAATAPASTSRALGAHARSLEIYDQLGLLGDIAAHGTRVNAFIRHEGEHASRLDFDFGSLTTQFPYMFNIDQVIIERVLRAHAASAGVAPEWGTALESFQQDAEGVTVELRRGADTESVRARYLWGCDGGHSTVRKALGLRLEGESAHAWLIADAVVHTDLDRDGVHWLFPRGGTMMLFPFPEPGKWRLLDTSGEGDPADPAQIAEQFATKLSDALGRETRVEAPTWASKFTIQQRAVATMHVGRAFLSGDAAHVHSPASGQGLNTGIQDAFNLAWKLAMVVHGDADPSLLDSYDAERVPIGRALLASTGKVMGTAMTSPQPGSDRSELDFMRQLIRSMSGLAIAYPDSALTVPDASSAGPRAGQHLTQITVAEAQSPGWMAVRDALRRPTWHLIAFCGAGAGTGIDVDIQPPWMTVLRVSRAPVADAPEAVWDADGSVHRTLGAGEDDWMLVRPDGYLSARGSGPASVRDALDRLTGLRVDAGRRAA